jgi:hypothetical protein
MIETLISSKTRVKLLLKFFLNSRNTAYLRNLEEEFEESTNGIRVELNKFEKAKMLTSEQQGKKKIFTVNTSHPLFKELHTIVLKYVGLDKIVDYVVKELGDLEMVYLTGSFARGLDSDIIDLVFIGNIDKAFLNEIIEKIEKKIQRRIRYIDYDMDSFDLDKLKEKGTSPLLLWSR